MVRRRLRRRREHLGVWDPSGGEERAGSGLPVEEGREVIRVLGRGKSGGVREIPVEEMEGTFWVDLLRPHDRSRELLEGLGLDALVVEDCLAPLRMPKVDLFPEGGAFVAAFAARFENGEGARLRAVEMDLVVGETYLVSVRDAPAEEVARRVEKRLGDGEEPSGEALAHAALDAMVDGHLPALASAAASAEELEDKLDPENQRSSNGALEELISLRRDCLAFRRLAVAQQEAVRRFGRTSSEGLRDYFADVADNQREAVDMADATRDYIEGVIESYRARRDERSEVGIRRLTVLAAVLGPLTVLAGWYGMNFESIPGASTPWGFPVFVVVQVALVGLALWVLWRRGLF